MIERRKKEAAPCSLDGAAAASIKLVQNYILTQFNLQTLLNTKFDIHPYQKRFAILHEIHPDKDYISLTFLPTLNGYWKKAG